MTTKLYIAASWSARTQAREAKQTLENLGYTITSTWIEGHDEFILAHSYYAKEDLGDIDRADAVLLFTDVPSSTGGFHVELGYALGKGKPVIIIGPRTNLFHHLPKIQVFPTLTTFITNKTQ